MVLLRTCASALLLAAAATRADESPPAAVNATTGLFAIAMYHNGPVEQKILAANTVTGVLTERSEKLVAEVGTDDLSVIADGVYYLLGDTHNGTTLVGIDLATGSQVCTAFVPLREIGFVGIGQTLDYDFKNGNLVMSGLANNLSAPVGQQVVHKVMRAGLGPDCGEFTAVGTFPLAANEPMLHASAIDVDGQRLFVSMALDQFGHNAIGVVDLKAATLVRIDLEDPTAPSDVLVGMVYDHVNKTLLGVLPGGTGLALHRINPANGKFSPAEAIGGPGFQELGGNEGSVSAFDHKARQLYVIGKPRGVQPGQPSNPWSIIQIDVDGPAVVSHPEMQGDPYSKYGFDDMAWGADKPRTRD